MKGHLETLQFSKKSYSGEKNRWFYPVLCYVKQTSWERPKSAPYLRLKNSKRTSKCQIFSSTVPAWGKNWTKIPSFLKIFFRFFFWSSASRIVPKNVKGGPLGVFEHPFFCKIEKNDGDSLETKKVCKKSLTMPKKKPAQKTHILLLGRPQ